jgi:hypothetical protein
LTADFPNLVSVAKKNSIPHHPANFVVKEGRQAYTSKKKEKKKKTGMAYANNCWSPTYALPLFFLFDPQDRVCVFPPRESWPAWVSL